MRIPIHFFISISTFLVWNEWLLCRSTAFQPLSSSTFVKTQRRQVNITPSVSTSGKNINHKKDVSSSRVVNQHAKIGSNRLGDSTLFSLQHLVDEAISPGRKTARTIFVGGKGGGTCIEKNAHEKKVYFWNYIRFCCVWWWVSLCGDPSTYCSLPVLNISFVNFIISWENDCIICSGSSIGINQRRC